MAVAGGSSSAAMLFRVRPRPVPSTSFLRPLPSTSATAAPSKVAAFTTSSSRRDEVESELNDAEDGDPSGGRGGGRRGKKGRKASPADLFGSLSETTEVGESMTPMEWLTGPGARYRRPTPGRPNWLGGDVPFPRNPWFRPPPPLSDKLRDRIYVSFKTRLSRHLARSGSDASTSAASPSSDADFAAAEKAEAQMVRETSAQWGVAIPRVEAVIRLKALEEARVQKGTVPLQTNFEKGMEMYLGVDRRVVKQTEDVQAWENKKQERRKAFYGVEFVDPDDDGPVEHAGSDEATGATAAGAEAKAGPKKRYVERPEPVENRRQILGPDGLPRPSVYHVVRSRSSPDHIDMAFRDVSAFPRPATPVKEVKPKRVSKRVALR